MSSKHSDRSNFNASSKALSSGEGLGEADLNCDMGEGIGNDEAILPYISSANIACAYHAGDEKTIWQTIESALKYKVAIGAHPSFHDKEHFGRREINLPPEEIYELVTQQLILFDEIAITAGGSMQHVKPHGALYNMSAKNTSIAKAIAQAVKDHDRNLVLFGLSGSFSISEARALGVRTASEVFADRNYEDDGSLTPRSLPPALIEEAEIAVQHVLQMVKKGMVTTRTGKIIPIVAETICIHGDGENAAAFAKEIYQSLKQNGIEIKSI